MKNRISIQNPCPENWEEMQDAPEGKFCEKCSKCVVDLTEKTDDQIQEMIRQAEGKEICRQGSQRDPCLQRRQELLWLPILPL